MSANANKWWDNSDIWSSKYLVLISSFWVKFVSSSWNAAVEGAAFQVVSAEKHSHSIPIE